MRVDFDGMMEKSPAGDVITVGGCFFQRYNSSLFAMVLPSSCLGCGISRRRRYPHSLPIGDGSCGKTIRVEV